MTNEEALKDIKECIKPLVGGISLDVAIEALEKQIPAEVFYDEVADFDTIRCPTCDTPVDEYYCEKFCRNCGQRLLWSKWWLKNDE